MTLSVAIVWLGLAERLGISTPLGFGAWLGFGLLGDRQLLRLGVLLSPSINEDLDHKHCSHLRTLSDARSPG